MIFEKGEEWSIEAEMAELLEQMKRTDAGTNEYQKMVDAYARLEAAKLARDKFEDEQVRKDEQLEFEERKAKREYYEHMQRVKTDRMNMWAQLGKGVFVGVISLAGMYLIIDFEQTGPIASKAFSIFPKPWQNMF